MASSALAVASGASAPLPTSPPEVKPPLYCKDDPDAGRYWIRIEGDGAPQVLREGTRISAEGMGAKWCSPYGIKVDNEVRASACASRDKFQSCLFLRETSARYVDRDGKPRDLTVSSLSSRYDAGVVDGTATLRSANGALKLAVSFHVGVRAWLELDDASTDRIVTARPESAVVATDSGATGGSDANPKK